MNTYSAREWLRRLFGREEPAYDRSRAVARPPADFVELNERGTEAAAATAPAMLVRAMARPSRPAPIPVFRADRPFLYAIRDRHSGALLFLGRMADPTRGS